MRSLRKSDVSRRRHFEVGRFAVLASFLTVTLAHAAERPLTNGDVERYLPRLRAEASAMERATSQALEAFAAADSASAEHEKLLADIASGKTDVLAWLRAHTDYALIPVEAVYSAECSRAVTAEAVRPTAVFTFGKESPYEDLLRRATKGDSAALEEFERRRGEEEIGGRSAAAQAIRDLVTRTVSFYRDRGFVETDDINRPVIVTWLVAPDKSVLVSVWDVNVFAGVVPRPTPTVCSSLPTGPLVEIELHIEAREDTASAAAPDEKPDPDYERVKEALILARIDASNPSALEVTIPTDAPPEAKAWLRELQAEYAVRKANVAVYLRHQAALAPILKALVGPAQQ